MRKIKYRPKRGAGKIAFEDDVIYIELPNGDEYSLKYDAREQGLVLNKVEGADGRSCMMIMPCVSNQILIK